MLFEEKIIATIVITICAVALIIARKFKNKDATAGYGIAGWTIFILLSMWVRGF